MYVGGSVISSVEFHGNMSLVLFMSGCPLTCRYCHNVELLDDKTEKSLEEIKKEIDSSADFLDAIVISGGEPLMQTDAIIEIFSYVRQIGLKTKLDTSGVYPDKRTTYVPTLHTKKDIINLADEIEADIYTIQQFRNKNVLDPALEKVEVPNPHDLADLAREIKPYFDGIVKVKSAEFGEQVIE